MKVPIKMVKFKLVFLWLRYNFTLRLLSALPYILAYEGVKILGIYDSLVKAKARKEFIEGITIAFPDMATKELRYHWYLHSMMLAREQLDIYFYPRMSHSNFDSTFKLKGLGLLQEAQRQGQGVVLAMCHYGRPLMLSTCLGRTGLKISFLTQTIDERNQYLNSVERNYLSWKMKRTIDASGGRYIMLDDSMRPLYNGLMAGEMFIVMFDLHELKPAKRLVAPFFNGELSIPRGIERLANRTGAKIVYGVARDREYKIEVDLCELPPDPREALMAAVGKLEKDVKENPWQWWQWRIFNQIWSFSKKGE